LASNLVVISVSIGQDAVIHQPAETIAVTSDSHAAVSEWAKTTVAIPACEVILAASAKLSPIFVS
jgi:hypothetical protein